MAMQGAIPHLDFNKRGWQMSHKQCQFLCENGTTCLGATTLLIPIRVELHIRIKAPVRISNYSN